MTSWHQRLTATGLLLILAGFIFALLYSWSVDHEARLVAHDAYQPVFEQIATAGRRAGEWQALEEEISRYSTTQRRAADVHGHSINMGILLILIGLFAPIVAAEARWLLAMAVAAIVYPVGLFLQFLGLGLGGEVVSAVGAAGALATLGLLYFRVSRAVDKLSE